MKFSVILMIGFGAIGMSSALGAQDLPQCSAAWVKKNAECAKQCTGAEMPSRCIRTCRGDGRPGAEVCQPPSPPASPPPPAK